jgi:WD40 repeat protein/serine/threonine protein kinase
MNLVEYAGPICDIKAIQILATPLQLALHTPIISLHEPPSPVHNQWEVGMEHAVSFGQIVKGRRGQLGLTQAELGRRVGCAPITVRKIEADALRPSVQIAERLAVALNVPEAGHRAFVRLARAEHELSSLFTLQPTRDEIGLENLGGRAIRGFELGERIGAGGFGVVYRALQTSVGREVAIKIILPAFADQPDFVRRFEAEAQIIAGLEHPYIVPLYDYWREPGAAYLVMRLLRGGSLAALLNHGPLPAQQILNVLEQVGAALHAAHRSGVIHRDIKPANILLDEDGNAFLSDFGIAKSAADSAAGAVVGPAPYIAPEQIRAEPVTPQTDIYALGVMLYELLTGRQPFTGSTLADYIQQHLNEPLPLLADDVPHTPTDLDRIIARATAKQPAERYPDLLHWLADIRAALTPGASALTQQSGPAQPAAGAQVTDEIALPDLISPYKGLRPFTEADAADFFGREMLIQDLLTRLSESVDLVRFLAVVGPSGSGKSSVVRAGLIPALRKGGLPGSEHWFISEMLPGGNPFAEVAAALLRVAVNPPADLPARLRADERGLIRSVAAILPNDPAVELTLVIDQFEEVFTLVDDETTRAAFLASLTTAVLDPESRLRVIITLRADFVDQPLRYVDFGELVRQRTEFVLPLGSEELEQAITRPTERAGLRLEPAIVPTISSEIGDHPGMLPLLQYALTELFERREGRTLTLRAYRASGGVLGALARRADELYTGLDAPGREAARQLFLRLITLGEGVEDTRRRVARVELDQLAPTDGGAAIGPIIDLYGRYRLLTFDRDPISRSPTVELAHEAILREWDRLRDWLSSARADMRMQRLLSAGAAEWLGAAQEEGYLLRGARLDQFAGWANRTQLALTSDERAFLDASLAARAAEQATEEERRRRELETTRQLAETEARRAAENARAARRLRWLAAGLALLLLAAVGLAAFASTQRDTALRNFARAEQIRLAAQAQIALDSGAGGELPALLALRSLQYGYSPEADVALLGALNRGFARRQYLGHTAQLGQVSFSPDGLFVVTSSVDHSVRLWDARTGAELRRFMHDGPVNNVVFSPDGRYLLSDSFDHTARLWNAATGAELRRFPREASESYGAEFSPDGKLVVIGDGPIAYVWNLNDEQALLRLTGHSADIYWCEFSPDGRYVLTAGGDHTARLWDAATGAELRRFLGHADAVTGAKFSPDGRYVLTASADRTARLWDITSGLEVRRFVGHTDLIFDAAFSPDGRLILTGSNDKTARLWDAATGAELRQFLGHTGGVGPPDFSPSGQFVLTGSTDRTARLWDVEQSSEPRRLSAAFAGHVANLFAAKLSTDGRSVLTVGQTIKRWDLERGVVTQELPLTTATMNAQALSSDGRMLITAHTDGLARLWDLEGGAELRRLTGHSGQVWDVAFAADGRTALTGGEDGSARLWDVASGTELQRFSTDNAIRALAFGPDRRAVLTGGQDGVARLWDLQTGQELRRLTGHSGPVQAAAISPDGRLALTGGEDGTARLWEVASGRQIRLLSGHSAPITAAVFAPDGGSVLTGSADQTARLWDVASGNSVRQLVGHSAPLTFVGFSDDRRLLLTTDNQSAFVWRARMEEVIDFACTQLARDFSAEERTRYNIVDTTSSCATGVAGVVAQGTTWTPVPTGFVPASSSALLGTPVPKVIEMEFANESINIGMNMPIGDVYIDAGAGQVARPRDLNPETLAQPLYRTAVEVPLPLEPPGDAGPFPKGEPLGFTLGEWLSAIGRGSYTVNGSKATATMVFDKLVPNGLYTLWCVEIHTPPEPTMVERPCGAPDGSQNTFTADANGHAEVTIEIDAFPPSTERVFYSIALAYHSDGLTHGPSVGRHGLNAHAHIFYDFVAPDP